MINGISGAVAGVAASFVVTPYERIKILLQTQQTISNKELYNHKNLFKGLSATFTREGPGFMFYFVTYDLIKQKVYKGKYTTFGSFCAGGISGAVAWCFIYPQDMVKTKIQSQIGIGKSATQIIKDIYNEGGLLGFYKKFHWALFRAVPLHAGTFATMEYLKKINN
jgi:hypothetical protein